MTDKNLSRRRFLKLGVSTAAAVPLASLLSARLALAAEGEKLDESDPSAQALGYKHDGNAVDTAKYPGKAGDGAGNTCANCQLYGGGDWGACAIFPGKQVKAEGWCSAWVAKQG